MRTSDQESAVERCAHFRIWVLAFAAIVPLAACTRHPSPQVLVLASPAPAPSVAFSQRDLGASTLAAIDNARQAIELHDAIAAGNDVGQALAFARQMIDQVSAILPLEPPSASLSRSSGHECMQGLDVRLRSFAVRVKLISAQALLTSGDLAGADAELSAVENRVPSRLLPRDLPLLRAGASLDLAKDDASLGLPQIRTQLLCTQASLRSYDGPRHIEDAIALATTVDHALANPKVLSTLLPYQISLWLGGITEWVGSDRW